MYTQEKVRSLLKTITYRRGSLENNLNKLGTLKEFLATHHNTADNLQYLELITDLQNSTRKERAFANAFIEELNSQLIKTSTV